MEKNSKIFVVGHGGIIEDSLVKHFQSEGYSDVFSSTEIGLDPTVQSSVQSFFQDERPEYVFLSSTRSGGIEANQNHPGEFIYHNVASASNVIAASWKFGIKKLLYIGSSCAYPKDCPQPMKEEYLLTGGLEETSEPYSVAKIAGIKMCQSFRRQYDLNAIAMIPATLYGPYGNEDPAKAHVLGALADRFRQAVKDGLEEISVWGSGTPKREFLYADDFVRACLFLMDNYDSEEVVNAGCGADITIKELAEEIAAAAGFKGRISFDSSKPDGVMRKLLDSSKILSLGFQPKTSLKEGLLKTLS